MASPNVRPAVLVAALAACGGPTSEPTMPTQPAAAPVPAVLPGPGVPISPRPRTDLPAASTYTLDRTGTIHDFDDLAGAWTVANRRLRARGVGSDDWDEFPAASCLTVHLGGVVNVDEIHFPTKGWSGLTLRTFDLARNQWSIYWINSRDGVLFPPVVGGFTGARGEFYGEDQDDGRPVLVRFVWLRQGGARFRWEQAFSTDGGVRWETNWTMDLSRSPTATCRDDSAAP